jgi:hypothetical protein
MKKKLLAALVVLSNSLFVSAQSTLNAANCNPVAGEKFYQHDFDLGSATEGTAGAAITWDFSTCNDLGIIDSSTYFACTSGVCDSYPGSNIFVISGSTDTIFCSASSTNFSFIGYGYPSERATFSNPVDYLRYPLTYNTSFVDSAHLAIPSLFYSYRQRDSIICDGYGTLILPSKTETSVLRVHRISVQIDSSDTGIDTSMYEQFVWWKPGFHSPILYINLDTFAGTLYRYADYYTGGMSQTSVATFGYITNSLSVYPNPSSNSVTISFLPVSQDEATVSLVDMTGRAVMTKKLSRLELSENKCELNLQEFATGRYLVKLNYITGSMQAPLVVTK